MSELIDHTFRSGWAAEGPARLPDPAVRWLRRRLGFAGSTPAVPASLVEVPDSAVPERAAADLVALLGAANVLTETAARLGRAGGLSYGDLMRRRGGGSLAVPDCVVLPANPDEVQRVLDLCVRHDLAVVPFGGGTSVVGGVSALRGGKVAVIALDLVRLDQLVSVDPVSRTAVVQAGVRAPDAEALLGARGFTLGHFPQSFERATIGGFAATRSAGQASGGYGRFEDMVEGVRLATPAGQWRLGTAPASAAGPDLRHLVVGSEGTLGVVTEVELRVRPVPTAHRYEAWVVDGWRAGADVVRGLAQAHDLADVTRLSDMDETEVQLELTAGPKARALRTLLRAKKITRPCLLVLGWDGPIGQRRKNALRQLRGSRSVRLGRRVGESWRAHRFEGPRQRDALLDLGVCVETLETATYWARVSELRESVRSALTQELGGTPIVMCHLSHAYETGASLYFTVLAARDRDDPLGQWRRAKTAATDAIAHHGATITHHHAVGADHQPWLATEIGQAGIDVLRAAKRAVDPAGILNPGKLLGS